MATESAAKNVFKPDSDVHITLEDQQKINLFAKYNAKHEDYKSEIKQKTSELKNFDDAEDELMLRSDEDAAEAIPILIGGNFFYLSTEKATESLQKTRDKIRGEMSKLEDDMATLKDSMSSLKTQLYAKFGTHINLEGDD